MKVSQFAWVTLVAGVVSCAAPRTTPAPTPTKRPDVPTKPSSAATPPAPLRVSQHQRLQLSQGFFLRSSRDLSATGAAISTVGFEQRDWHAVTLPSTVLAGLVQAGVYGDPFAGNDLERIPSRAFKDPYWYRAELPLGPEFANQATRLRLDGVNYRADVWLNGKQVASAEDVTGTFVAHEVDVTSALVPNAVNALAIRVLPPNPPRDLSVWWQDWNPAPPDANMGIWQPIWLERSGVVQVSGTHVLTHVELPGRQKAELEVVTELVNTSKSAVTADVELRFEGRTLGKRVELAANERRTLRLTASEFASLAVSSPRLWWPRGMGEPDLYELELSAVVGEQVSATERVTFGIREVSFELEPSGHRLFRVNGKPFFMRGGGWASDLLLRSSPERLEAELALVRDLGLNTLRLEGKLETDAFYAAADRDGIALIAGWMCCDRWQESQRWTAAERRIARESTASQARRLRNHPSVLSFMIGSDEAPAPAVEQELVSALQAVDWNRPISAAASDRTTPLLGRTGVKMTGPYDWVSPYYWYEDTKHGGAFGFNTETSPGPALPELETLRAWLPPSDLERLWKSPGTKQFHAGRNEFYDIGLFQRALSARHGNPTSLEDFVRKAQLMGYEAERVLFESYSGRRYRSATGVLHWLTNSAWPSLIWHLYAHDLSTSASYFAAKKANEPLHVQYAYDDASVSVVNETTEATEVVARVQLLETSGAVRFEHSQKLLAAPDSVALVTPVPKVAGLSGVYFIRTSLSRNDQPLSDNWYWLSTRAERSAYERSDFYHAPVVQFADFRALNELPAANVTASVSGSCTELQVSLANASATVAFFVRLSLLDANGAAINPMLWDDNYVSLAAGERQQRRASPMPGARLPAAAVLRVSGWNVAAHDVALPSCSPR